MRDVAAVARVDQSTVSRILSGDDRLSVRAETRQRVLDAAQRLGYRPNAAARTLRTSSAMAIGMVLPSLQNVVYSTIAAGAQERAAQSGYLLLVMTGDALASLAGRVDALLLAIATSERPNLLELRDTVPVLLLNRSEPWGVPSITVDDGAGAALATTHLIELGHERIAHIAGPQNVDTARRRLLGFREAMARHGQPVLDELIVEAGYDEAGGQAAAARLLDLDPVPQAIFAANIMSAIGAISAIRARGLRVPDDISVVGFHDVQLAEYLDPPLTTVRMPLHELGVRAVDLLLSGGGEPATTSIDTPPELVTRASTAPRRPAPRRRRA
jgi:LacI family transcriptional regulator